MDFLHLGISVAFSTGRNLLSKKLSDIRFGSRGFFLCQSVLFLCGGAVIAVFGDSSLINLSLTTIICSLIYGLLLISAQWFYTLALSRGNTAMCSTIYSLGFVLPTLSGAFFWKEAFSFLNFLGVSSAVSAVVVSGIKSGEKKKDGKTDYFIPLLIAMLSSGGMGIMQKVQQKSAYPEQKGAFLMIAFLLASGISALVALLSADQGKEKIHNSKISVAACIGLFFGCCNLLNTSLAGRIDSAILFPSLNIGVVLLSMICGVIFFKEKISKKELAVLILDGLSILLLNLG